MTRRRCVPTAPPFVFCGVYWLGLPKPLENDLFMHMAKIKTAVTKASVTDFINQVKDPTQRADAKVLLTLFKKITKEKPKLWSNSIIGFGTFHYKSTHSAQEGDWMLSGFSPRKQALTIYLMQAGITKTSPVLKKLGKHKLGGGCLYIKRLADVDQKVLADVIKQAYVAMKKKTHHDYGTATR